MEQRYSTDEQGRPTGDLPTPVVAHSCRAVLDRRFIAEENLDAVKQEIIDMLQELKATRPGFDFGVREIMSFVPTATPQDAPVVDATARAIARVLGREPSYISSPGTYDQKHIVRTGKLRDCIAYGPGILDLAHQPDEYVGIQALEDSAKVMALAAFKLSGLSFDTKFSFSNTVELDYSSQWFKVPPLAPCGQLPKIGVLHAAYARAAYAAYQAVFA